MTDMSDVGATSGSDGEQQSCKNRLKNTYATFREYRNTIQRLEAALVNKDKVITHLKSEIDFKNVEMRRLEKSNRKLNQMLTEERSHYTKEKERFCSAIMDSKRMIARLEAERQFPHRASYPMRNSLSYLSQPVSGLSKASFYNSVFSEIAALKTENEKLRSLVETSDEKNHELCERFLRMKRSKELTWNKLREVDEDFLQTLKNIMRKFNDLREEFNLVVGDHLQPVSAAQDKYVQVSKSNCNLAYENSCLKLELQSLKKDIHNGLYGLSLQEKCKKWERYSSAVTGRSINSGPMKENTELQSKSKAVPFLESSQDVDFSRLGSSSEESTSSVLVTVNSQANGED